MNRHVLVTGGSRGIGAAIVRAAAHQEFDVTFTYLKDQNTAEDLVQELSAHGQRIQAIRADSADLERMPELLAEAETGFGAVTHLVNNAGTTGPLGNFADSDCSITQRMFDLNVHGPMALTQAAIRGWLGTGMQGVIVNVTSIAAVTGAPGEYVGYAASKAAMETFTKGLGRELGPSGIRVVAVSPGTTDTGIHALAGDPDRPNRVAPRVPLRRVANPSEIAHAVLWALSNNASYVTGTVITVAGGLG